MAEKVCSAAIQTLGGYGYVSEMCIRDSYLTVDSVWRIPGRLELKLKYPNLEVQASLNDSLLQNLCGGLSIPGPQISHLYSCLLYTSRCV